MKISYSFTARSSLPGYNSIEIGYSEEVDVEKDKVDKVREVLSNRVRTYVESELARVLGEFGLRLSQKKEL